MPSHVFSYSPQKAFLELQSDPFAHSSTQKKSIPKKNMKGKNVSGNVYEKSRSVEGRHFVIEMK